jgi:hypothetical protein
MRTKVGARGGWGEVVCRVLVHSKTRYKNMFLHLGPVAGVEYFPPKGTYVFMFYFLEDVPVDKALFCELEVMSGTIETQAVC